MFCDLPSRTRSLVQAQLDELFETLTDDEVDEFEVLRQSRSPRYWRDLLERNTGIVEDFLRRTPKQRAAKLRKPHKDHWLELHLLAHLAIRRALVFLDLESRAAFSDHWREIAADMLSFGFELDRKWRELEP